MIQLMQVKKPIKKKSIKVIPCDTRKSNNSRAKHKVKEEDKAKQKDDKSMKQAIDKLIDVQIEQKQEDKPAVVKKKQVKS